MGWSRDIRRHATGVLGVAPAARRWPVAVKAAAAMAIPLSVATALGHLDWALTCTLGAFCVLYGPDTAGRFRARLVAVAGLGLIVATALGALTQFSVPLHVASVVVVAVVSAMVCVALKVGPPGSYFFVLAVGVGGNLVHTGMPVGRLIASVTVGAVVAWAVTMSDLLRSPHAPERRAMDAAEAAITRAEDVSRESTDPAQEAAAWNAASHSLHHAWTTVTDGAGRRTPSSTRVRLAARMRHLDERYIRLAATATHRWTAVELAGPWDDGGDGPASVRDDALPGVVVEQLRETSLGRPRPGYLLRQAFTWPSEVLLVGLRVGLATSIAGIVAMLLGEGHLYWAVAFAALVLHQGGSRTAQTYRGIQRLLGTLGGLAVFMAMLWIAPSGWWLVLTLVALQFGVEMLVVRNYALACILITPLALTVVHVGSGIAVGPEGDGARRAVLSDRFVDTVLAVCVAWMVLWLVGRRTPLLIFRTQGRRCLLAMRAVMADLGAGSVDTVAARERRRHLYYELLEYDAVGNRALADDPARVRPYLAMRAAVVELGYLVLGACWHPDLRTAHDLFTRAQHDLEPILSVPVTKPREADAILADVLAVRSRLARWSGEG